MNWIQTYTGRKFDLMAPTPDMVCLEDIAHALSNICRFTGHTRRFYSVAEHSCRVAMLLRDEHPLVIRQALLHDAAEAYVADIASPLKDLLPDYRQVERRVWRVIAALYGLSEELDALVKQADAMMLMRERADLLSRPPEPWHPKLEAIKIEGIAPVRAMSPIEAYQWFMQCAHGLGVRE